MRASVIQSERAAASKRPETIVFGLFEALDHVIVHAELGLSLAAQETIDTLRWLHSAAERTGIADGTDRINVCGRRFRGLKVRVALAVKPTSHLALADDRFWPALRIFGAGPSAPVWESLSPFVPLTFFKKSERSDLLGQIQAELESRGFPLAERGEILNEASQRMARFERVRQLGDRPPPQVCGFAVRLHFPRHVPGPLALRYGNHFRLGLTVATNGAARTGNTGDCASHR